MSQMLNYVDKATEERILQGLGAVDEELPVKVRELMFGFEDLSGVDDKSMQTIIREVEREKWAIALRTASQDIKDKIFKNMSQRAADLLREDMEGMGPVRLSEVEAVQREVLDLARKLDEDGQIILIAGKGGVEDALV